MTTQLPSSTRTPPPEWRFWLIVGVVLALLVWLLSPVLTPFLVAMLIAYFLDPPVRKMSRLGVPRGASAVIVLILFIAFIALLVIVLGPLIREQAVGFADALPGYIDQLQNNVWPRISAAITEHFPTFSTA